MDPERRRLFLQQGKGLLLLLLFVSRQLGGDVEFLGEGGREGGRGRGWRLETEKRTGGKRGRKTRDGEREEGTEGNEGGREGRREGEEGGGTL
jgi:hypothetical protein